MHTTGDPLVVVQQERAYAQAVRAAGNAGLLRQAFVHRAGHCTFTPADVDQRPPGAAAAGGLGTWGDTTAPQQLNPAAEALGSTLNLLLLSATVQVPTPPAFLDYAPALFNLPPFAANVADPLQLDAAA